MVRLITSVLQISDECDNSHIEQHSKKPDEVRDKIVKLMGDQPRVELFARQKTPGWDVWGNEVNCTLTMPERKG